MSLTIFNKDGQPIPIGPFEWQYEWHFYRKTALVKAKRMGEAFKVATLEGTMKGKAGDYLCEGHAGEQWPIKKEIFEATYQLEEQPEPERSVSR